MNHDFNSTQEELIMAQAELESIKKGGKKVDIILHSRKLSCLEQRALRILIFVNRVLKMEAIVNTVMQQLIIARNDKMIL